MASDEEKYALKNTNRTPNINVRVPKRFDTTLFVDNTNLFKQ